MGKKDWFDVVLLLGGMAIIVSLIWYGTTVKAKRESGVVNDLKAGERFPVVDDTTVKIYVVDHCQYLGYNVGNTSGFFTHKGNCTNCEAKRK